MGKIILNGTEYAGSGGSGGHTIVDPNGTDMPQENKLQFTGAVSVSDDSANGQTVVGILGGGGNVYGAFIDPTRVIYSSFVFDSSAHTWTATEDCILTDNMLPPDSTTAYFIRIDGKQVFAGYNTVEDPFVYVKKGQVVEYRAKSGSTMKAYGITQGTNGIFAPVIYSDTERVIGVWRDNKPLYQRTFVLPNPIDVLYSSWTSMGVSVADGERIVRCEGEDNTDGLFNPLMAYFNNGVIECQTPRNNSNAWQIKYLSVWYTKTTDVAGSGNWNTNGVPTHHYSTNEQVIGTWIDGKPLYECIVDGLSLAVNIDWSSEVATNLNIKYLVNATLYDNSNPNNPIVVNVEQVQVLNGGFRIAHSTNSSGRTITRAIIQYTKTTD